MLVVPPGFPEGLGYPEEIDRVSIDGILHSGNLTVRPGEASCWSGGKMIAPVKMMTVD